MRMIALVAAASLVLAGSAYAADPPVPGDVEYGVAICWKHIDWDGCSAVLTTWGKTDAAKFALSFPSAVLDMPLHHEDTDGNRRAFVRDLAAKAK